jgi:4a-hydroxytetrahydrobiopterin dehydratase
MTELAALAARRCTPRKGEADRLAPRDLQAALPALPGWEVVDDGAALRKTFRFGNYYETLAFVNALAFVAHREDHHPDLGVHYDRCVVRFSTHDVGGLSENDLVCAAKAEQLARR